MSQLLDVAKNILEPAGRKGLHISDIAKAAVEQNKNIGLSLEDFQRKIGAALAANLKTKKPSFANVNHSTGPRKGKPKQGWYRLKEERSSAPPLPTAPPVQKNFLGKAGEYAVMSELLFWQYNVSSMIVDDGIDLVASKDNKFFHIQVKTSSCQNGNTWHFTVSKTSFLRYQSGNVFYVFVLRRDTKNAYFVMPSSQISYLISSKIIADGQTLSINISERKREYFIGKHDITPFFGNFSSIK